MYTHTQYTHTIQTHNTHRNNTHTKLGKLSSISFCLLLWDEMRNFPSFFFPRDSLRKESLEFSKVNCIESERDLWFWNRESTLNTVNLLWINTLSTRNTVNLLWINTLSTLNTVNLQCDLTQLKLTVFSHTADLLYEVYSVY